MKNRISLAIILPGMLVLQGCASMLSMGEAEYSCPGIVNSGTCQSVMDNHEFAQGSLEDFRKKVKLSDEGAPPEDTGEKEEKKGKVVNDPKSPSNTPQIVPETFDKFTSGQKNLVIVNNPFAQQSVPIVEKPRVYKVWFAPRIGQEGRFYGEHNVFFIKGSSKWKDSHKYVYDASGIEMGKPKMFRPLQVKKANKANKPSTTTAPLGMGQSANLFK
jgi:type IV conjugative transfer system lipoprotein TraV